MSEKRREPIEISDSTIEEIRQVSEANRLEAIREEDDKRALRHAQMVAGNVFGIKFEVGTHRYEIILRDADDKFREITPEEYS